MLDVPEVLKPCFFFLLILIKLFVIFAACTFPHHTTRIRFHIMRMCLFVVLCKYVNIEFVQIQCKLFICSHFLGILENLNQEGCYFTANATAPKK